MVVSIVIENFMVSKVLIDQGSSMNILYQKTFQRLEVSSNTVQPHSRPLLGFSRERVETKGYVDLMTTFGQGQLSRSFTVMYLIIDVDTFYFALIGNKTLNKLEAIVSTPHLKMKFPTLMGEIMTVKVDQKQARQCYVESLKAEPYPPSRQLDKPNAITGDSSQVISLDKGSPIRTLIVYKASLGDQDGVFDVDPCDDTVGKCPKPIEELVKLQLRPKSRQFMQLSRDLTSHEYKCIVEAQQGPYQPSDMSGIHPSIICHKLAICPQAKLVSQKKRKMGEE